MKKEKENLSPKKKNEHIFKMLNFNTSFLALVSKIRINHILPYSNKPIEENDLVEILKHYKQTVGVSKFNLFSKEINILVRTFGLGEHWKIFFVIYFLTGQIVYPSKMTDEINLKKCIKEKQLLFEINQYTTLEDIQREWPKIKKIKKKIWKNGVAEKISKDTVKGYDIFIEDIKLRGKETEDIIFKTKRKMTDIDKVAHIWQEDDSEITAKRKAQVLKQNRKRFKDDIEDMDLQDLL